MKRFSSTLSVLLYLSFAVLAGFAHHDTFPSIQTDTESVSTHNCGPTEAHAGLESAHQCLLCLRSTPSVVILEPLAAEIPSFSARLALQFTSGQPNSECLPFSTERGPPVS